MGRRFVDSGGRAEFRGGGSGVAEETPLSEVEEGTLGGK